MGCRYDGPLPKLIFAGFWYETEADDLSRYLYPMSKEQRFLDEQRYAWDT